MRRVTLRKINADKKLCDRKLMQFNEELSAGRLTFSGFMLASKNRIGNMTADEFIQRCKSNWQSFGDIIKRRDYLNNLNIQFFGGRTSVEGEDTFLVTVPKFNGCDKFNKSVKETLTIAQAIGRKNFLNGTVIPILNRFQTLASKTIAAYDNMVTQQHDKLLRQVNQQFGSESAQTSKERIAYQDKIAPLFEVVWIDPLNIETTIAEILDQMLDYLNEIDSAISRATETTEVDIED